MIKIFWPLIVAILSILSLDATPVMAEDGLTEEVTAQTLTGRLIRMAAIGGETTGYGLRTATRTVELDLNTHHLASRFQEGRRATVSGYFATVHGVEIPSREVFVVTSLRINRRPLTRWPLWPIPHPFPRLPLPHPR